MSDWYTEENGTDDLDLGSLGLDEVEADAGYSLLEPGDYPFVIDEAKSMPHKDGTGVRVSLRLKIVGNKGAGRSIYDSLSVIYKAKSTAPDAVSRARTTESIARSRLKALCESIGVSTSAKLSDFAGREGVARIGVSKPNPEYGQRNEVKAYRKADQPGRPSFLG